jgi:hypothetical protein
MSKSIGRNGQKKGRELTRPRALSFFFYCAQKRLQRSFFPDKVGQCDKVLVVAGEEFGDDLRLCFHGVYAFLLFCLHRLDAANPYFLPKKNDFFKIRKTPHIGGANPSLYSWAVCLFALAVPMVSP